MKNYIFEKDKSVMRQLCHRFILFLLRVSKSKYKLIEPFEHIQLKYQTNDPLTVKSSEIFNQVTLIKHYNTPSMAKNFVEKEVGMKLLSHLIEGGLIRFTTGSTKDMFKNVVTAEIKVLRPYFKRPWETIHSETIYK